MAISDLLNRRVRARPEEDEEIYSEASGSGDENHADEPDPQDDSDDSIEDDENPHDDDSEEGAEEEEQDDSAEEGSDDHSDDGEDVQASLGNISFGALAKAQASLGPKSKRKSKSEETATSSTSSPLDEIRAKIREAREQKSKSLKDVEKPSRSSKHAPMVQSSKRAVTRKRTIIEPPATAKSRDPRFDPTVRGASGRHNNDAAQNRYAFLDEYRAAELKELKEKMAKTKNLAEKEELKAAIRSATDRERAIQNKRREKEVIAEHKKREKQLILEGKKSNPYFLKKSDLKKQVLVKKYESMKPKERTKALERRQKKMASKERREMPMERRGFEGGDAPSFADGDRKRRRVA